MKSFITLLLLAILFLSPNAFAQPTCLCDKLELSNGNSGAEIIDILCPGGNLAAGNSSLVVPDEVLVVRPGGEKLELSYAAFIDSGIKACGIFEDTVGENSIALTDDEYESCRQRLIQGCNLNQTTSIPTLSEWGVKAMAGVLGIVGLYIASRRRKATA